MQIDVPKTVLFREHKAFLTFQSLAITFEIGSPKTKIPQACCTTRLKLSCKANLERNLKGNGPPKIVSEQLNMRG